MQTDLPDADLLRQLIHYDKITGKMVWRARPVDMFGATKAWKAWNTRYSGKEAFTHTMGNGYRRGSIFCTNYLAHRVIWAICTGSWPVETIDHKNGNPSDNRWDNLRAATHAQNQQNKGLVKSSSGVKGVCWNPRRNKWLAQIQANNRSIFLGHFDTKDDAAKAYAQASSKFHGEFGRVENFAPAITEGAAP